MKKALLFAISFVFLTSATRAADWARQEISPSVSILFPGQAHITRLADQVSYLYQTDSCSYLVQTKHYKDEGKVRDSKTLVSFYDGMAKGMLKAAKGTVLKKDSFKISGLSGMELEYVRGDENSLPVTVYSRALLAGGEVIVYSFTAPTQAYDHMKPLREKFLSSVSFTKDSVPEQYHPVTTPDASAPTGSAAATDNVAHTGSFLDSHAGKVVKVFFALILFCALIYFLAVFSRRKG